MTSADLRAWLRTARAKTAFVAGTGLAVDLSILAAVDYLDVGLKSPTTRTHAGRLEQGTMAGHRLIQARGRLHAYETGRTDAMAPLYQALAEAGVQRVIISGAVGSLTGDLPPGALAQVHDHLFFGGGSPLTGQDNAFVDMGHAYQLGWADLPAVTYAWTHGPHLETPAEIQAFKAMGAQVVGMSLAPEAILARYFGLEVHGLVAVVNWAAGQGPSSSIEQILAQAQATQVKIVEILKQALKQLPNR